MRFLAFQAYLRLMQFDRHLTRGNFSIVHDIVRNYRQPSAVASHDVVERVCRAVNLACIWYWKEALCLQRSAATVCLLRQCGVAATLVIGVQSLPFKAHAWVEVDGRVVNEKPYLPDMYMVLDRC